MVKTLLMRFSGEPAFLILGGPLLVVRLLSGCIYKSKHMPFKADNCVS